MYDARVWQDCREPSPRSPKGVGALKFPLKPAAVRNLVAQCRVAPSGQGTQTLVDKRVRNTLELDPQQFRLGPQWKAALERVARQAGEELGLPPARVEARLYKLLVYEKGGFFLPHRDSEKDDGMVASLIVVLPQPFAGGALEVRATVHTAHNSRRAVRGRPAAAEDHRGHQPENLEPKQVALPAPSVAFAPILPCGDSRTVPRAGTAQRRA